MSTISRINRRKFIQYGSLTLGSGIVAACTNSNKAPSQSDSVASNSASGDNLDKVTFATNWYAQAEHGGFYQAVATGFYKANRWQTLLYLRLPSALPYFLGGLRISGGLALIGAVVAEFVAGTGGARSGLAYQILMASYNLQIPRMFAALFLTTALGVVIFVLLTFMSDFLLSNWHESAVKREN